MPVVIESIARSGGRIEVHLEDGVVMYFNGTADIREFLGRAKEDEELKGALSDILARDPGLTSPGSVTRWEYTGSISRRVL